MEFPQHHSFEQSFAKQRLFCCIARYLLFNYYFATFPPFNFHPNQQLRTIHLSNMENPNASHAGRMSSSDILQLSNIKFFTLLLRCHFYSISVCPSRIWQAAGQLQYIQVCKIFVTAHQHHPVQNNLHNRQKVDNWEDPTIFHVVCFEVIVNKWQLVESCLETSNKLLQLVTKYRQY